MLERVAELIKAVSSKISRKPPVIAGRRLNDANLHCRAPTRNRSTTGSWAGPERARSLNRRIVSPTMGGMSETHRRVLLAKPRGYCAGVDRAVQAVEMALERFGAPV